MKRSFPASLPLALLFALATATANASPPPPPPEYVWDAGKVLTDAAMKDQNKIAMYFADDVFASVNSQVVANGKAAWLKWWSEGRSHYYGRTLGYSEGWEESGTLLVFDSYDTVDYSTNPPPLGDPRPSTRSTLYQFGPDHLIHSVQIGDVNAFMMLPGK